MCPSLEGPTGSAVRSLFIHHVKDPISVSDSELFVKRISKSSNLKVCRFDVVSELHAVMICGSSNRVTAASNVTFFGKD